MKPGAYLGLAILAAAILPISAASAADRRVVVDPNASPWSAVAKVQTNIGTSCTGVLIAPAVVLTAAHCLYSPRTQALLQAVSLHVLFGFERDVYRWHRLVVRVTVGPGFDGRRHRLQSSDWTKLQLAESVPVPPLPIAENAPTAGLQLAMAGYNRDRSQLLMADTDCHVLGIAPAADGGTFLTDDCEGTFGTSGSPLLARQNNGWAVIAIAIAAGRDANLALPVQPLAGSQPQAWKP